MSPYRTNEKPIMKDPSMFWYCTRAGLMVASLIAIFAAIWIHADREEARRARVICETHGMRPLWRNGFAVVCAADGRVCEYSIDTGRSSPACEEVAP